MPDEMVLESVLSETPTDVEHPLMYERATYFLGAITILAVLGLIALAIMEREISEGLVSIGSVACGGLVALLTRQA